MSALTPDMLGALAEARAADPRPEAIALWDAIERKTGESADPAAALHRICERLLAETDKIRAERGVTV